MNSQINFANAGHVVGAIAALGMIGTLGATAKPAVGPVLPQAIDYLLLD
jgi:hypothetical protein